MSFEAARLRQLRLAAGLKQAELGQIIGIDQRQISRYETGTAEPMRDQLDKLVQALKTNQFYLTIHSWIYPGTITEAHGRLISAWETGDYTAIETMMREKLINEVGAKGDIPSFKPHPNS